MPPPLDLSDEDGYNAFWRWMSNFDESWSGTRRRHLSSDRDAMVQLWTSTVTVGSVAGELSELDFQARTAAANYLPQVGRRFYPYPLSLQGGFGVLPPVDPTEGGFELVRAEQTSSLLTDLEPVGLVLSVLTDAPAVFLGVRLLSRRLPFRIEWRREGRAPQAPQEVEGAWSAEQAASFEAARIKSRLKIETPDGFSLIMEEFYRDSNAA